MATLEALKRCTYPGTTSQESTNYLLQVNEAGNFKTPSILFLLFLVQRRLKHHKPTAAFRSEFIYNNAMYGLAGFVAEKLAGGVSYESLVKSRIFEPLGMTSSTFNSEVGDWSKFATPYIMHNNTVFAVDKELLR